MSVDSADVSAERKAELLRECQSIRMELLRDLRHGRSPNTLAEEVEWEREFGPECDAKSPSRAEPRTRIELCKHFARRYGVSYATAKDAFAGVWA